MEANLCTVEVRVHGRPVREYRHNGQTFIEGRKGTDFVLRVRNTIGCRILAVISIDGLSIMDGKVASVNDIGYIIDPYEFIDIPGWRLNDHAIAKFVFDASAGSYAAQMDKPQNIGVIGCAIFKEEPRPPVMRHTVLDMNRGGDPRGQTRGGHSGVGNMTYNSATWTGGPTSSTTSPFKGGESVATVYCSSTPQVQQEVGTGFGAEQTHEVTSVEFNRNNLTPDETLEIRYDSKKALKKRGVPMRKPVTVTRKEPTPFPADENCKPPPGWKGARR